MFKTPMRAKIPQYTIPFPGIKALLYCLAALYFLAFTLVFVNTAWLEDDIFITFRAVDNFLKGYGPVWNVGERVQVYTHPLWYALLVIGIGIFKHHYWFTLALSYACLLGTLYLFLKIARRGNMVLAMLASVTLLLSRAFADYSSSGLENPLLHLLLCAYVLVSITQQDAAKRFLHTSLLYSLLFLTRPDAIILVTPASLWMLWQAYKASGRKRTLKLALLAAAPAMAWEAFSLIYYGSLVPNTAIAKTNLGYPRSEMLARGWEYLKHSFKIDPLTLSTMMLAAPVSIFLGRNHLPRLLMVGVALQLAYICWVGGDYMQGRFLTSSLLAAAIAIALSKSWKMPLRAAIPLAPGAAVAIIATVLAVPKPYTANIRYTPDYSMKSSISYWKTPGRHGQSDQRAFYYPTLGLLPVIIKHNFNPYTHGWITLGQIIKNKYTPNTVLIGCVGMTPWMAGERVYFVDFYALPDPYLARLPPKARAMPGHYRRHIPEGYIETLITGKNNIANNKLAAIFDDVALATRAPLLDGKRWAAIWRLGIGHHKILHSDFNRNAIGFPDENNNRVFPNKDTYFVGIPPKFSPFAATATHDPYSATSLNSTIAYGDAAALRQLLADAPDTGEFRAKLTAAAKDLCFLLINEAEREQDSKLKVLLDAGVDVNTSDQNGYSAFSIAMELGHAKIARFLLENGAKDTSESTNAAIINAVMRGHTDTVNWLLSKKASPNAADKDGKTVLFLALSQKHTDIAEILIRHGSSLDAAMMPASWQGDLKSVKFLIERGANINYAMPGGRWTALMHATFHGHKNIVYFLLDKGVDSNAKNSLGQTALDLATMKKHTDIIMALKNAV